AGEGTSGLRGWGSGGGRRVAKIERRVEGSAQFAPVPVEHDLVEHAVPADRQVDEHAEHAAPAVHGPAAELAEALPARTVEADVLEQHQRRADGDLLLAELGGGDRQEAVDVVAAEHVESECA